MSQHKHSTFSQNGRKVVVTLGYDRPLDYVFCTVMQCAEGLAEGEEVLYSNLGDDEAGADLQNVDYFRPVLATLGIRVPESMFTEVQLDQLQRVGNRTVVHD